MLWLEVGVYAPCAKSVLIGISRGTLPVGQAIRGTHSARRLGGRGLKLSSVYASTSPGRGLRHLTAKGPPVHVGGPSTPGALIRNWIGSREHWGWKASRAMYSHG